VLTNLRKERFPRGEYNKLKLKKIRPCRILRNFSTIAYEIELPLGIEISAIFNVTDLYKYKLETKQPTSDDQQLVQLKKQLATIEPTQPEKVLDNRLIKWTRGKGYFEYLVKWKND